MRSSLKILFSVIAGIYPVLVFLMLVVFRLPVRVLSLCFIIIAFTAFINATNSKRTGTNKKKLDIKTTFTSALLLGAGLFCFITRQSIFLRLYSVVINVSLLVMFGVTLFKGQSIIFRFAKLADRTIEGSVFENKVESYCRKVTVVWCLFFIANGTAAFYTTFFTNERIWSIYNGGISYVLMGLLFAIEFIIRKHTDKKIMKLFPITHFTSNSRNDNHILCYEDKWSKKSFKTWLDFLTETAKMRAFINTTGKADFLLHCEDYWLFLVTFTALLQCNKKVLLTQNISENYINEIKNDQTVFFTDQNCPDSVYIPQILTNAAEPSQEEIRTTPSINQDTTQIVMYTSGSTGHPKAVLQRMTEFNQDNTFIATKFGSEFTKRRLVTTVSQHHIYGFLFGITLPFALGVPFRRKRIEFPEEFEKLNDESYIIISTPAFLKRTCENQEKLNLKDTYIFTSGGAVSPELAVKTNDVFGVYPLEVYGSTETSGIAYRQQNVDQLVWNPFDNAKVWKGDDGTLRIISPYIKNPEGFATADLVEFIEGTSRFIMKGRSDSIVKIEEKRISLTEVENRLLESGLVSDVKVVAMSSEVRQYLAAAVVLNEEGKKKFESVEKFMINRYFHDYLLKYFENILIPKKWRFADSLPCDVQGKKHKDEIIRMFEVTNE